MNRYQSYKSSGVEWIGDIPIHWGFNKVGNNTYVKGRIGWKGLRSEDFIDEGPYLITGTDFNKDGTINWEQMYHVNQERYDEDSFIQLKDNDVLITKDGTIGKVVYVGNLRGQTCLNSGIFLTRPTNKDYISRFFFWVLNSNVFKIFVDYNSGGSTIQHLYQNVFVNFKFPIPTIQEQLQIVQFLDEKTELIDKLILTKERKITLLKEQKTSLINQVVTKGLNPNVKMKDSGVEWIEEIPEHWSFVNFGRICDVRQGLQIRFEERLSEKVENSYEYITTQSVHNPDQYKQYILNPKPNVICNENDILMGRTGNTGEVVTNVNGVFHNNFFLIDFNRKIISKEFLVWYLTNPRLREELLLLSGTTTIPDLNHGKFLSTKFVYPELKEQLQIVEHLNSKTKEIDDLVQLEQKKIDLLKEYRQSLISEVVTGKLKVTTDE